MDKSAGSKLTRELECHRTLRWETQDNRLNAGDSQSDGAYPHREQCDIAPAPLIIAFLTLSSQTYYRVIPMPSCLFNRADHTTLELISVSVARQADDADIS